MAAISSAMAPSATASAMKCPIRFSSGVTKSLATSFAFLAFLAFLVFLAFIALAMFNLASPNQIPRVGTKEH